MKKAINKIHVEGRVYDFTIAEKVTGEASKNPGTAYIGGTIDVATDDACLNVIQVNFTYVIETTAREIRTQHLLLLRRLLMMVRQSLRMVRMQQQ